MPETSPIKDHDVGIDQRFIDYCELACQSIDSIPKNVIEEIIFFMSSANITQSCRTNTCLAYQIGKLSAVLTGRNAILIEIVWLCIVAKDVWIKSNSISNLLSILTMVEKLSEAAEAWRIANLNY